MKLPYATVLSWTVLACLVSSPMALALTVDITDRESSRDFYNEVYLASDAAIGWTGNAATCDEGTTAQAFKDDVKLRVNYYRKMAGLGEVTFTTTYNNRCQKAALIRSRYTGGESPHDPQSDWACYTVEGSNGCHESNLSQGSYGWDAVDGQMRDAGAGNYPCGHRRYILFPNNRVSGSGSIPPQGATAAMALQAWDDHAWEAALPHREAYTAWPPPGYTPYPVVFGRWSFGYDGGNFSASTVTMTENGSPIAATLETYETITPADNTLVWRPKNVSDSYVWPNPGADDVYTVAISNVVIFTLESGYTTQNFFYTVIVFDPAVSGATVPGTPTSVRASDGTYTNTVRVEWAASEDADYYQIWRNLSDSLTGATCVKERHNSTLYWDNPPLPLTVFWYFVRAGNSEGFSSYSASDYGWAGMETPDAPQDVRASDGVHTDAVRVTWTKVDGATLYRLYRSRSNHQASAATLINRGADFDSYRDETVVPGTTYWYWVRAENAAGWGAYSGSDSGFATTNPPVPEPPEKVYASDGRFNSAIFVQWDVSDLAHGYEVWRNTVDSTASATKIHDATSAASVMDYAVLPGRFYWYWVRATNDVGVSDWSIHDVGFANVAGPSAPLVWASQGAALDRIRVIWLPTARTRGYEVWRNDSDTLIGATQLTNLPASRIFHDDWNVLPGQTNYYFVRATNLLAKGDFSDGAEGYTYWAPLAPTNVVATDGDYADRVVISWNAAPGAYSVWRSSNDNMSAATRIYYDSVSGCPDVTVTPGRYYYYQVSVASGGITSGLSAVDSGYAENSQPPPAPVPIASQGEYSAVFITWPHLPEVDPVESYDICRSEYDTMAGAVTLAVRFAQNNHFDWTTASDRGYYYSVRARDADGTGPWSAGAYGYVAGMVDAKPDIMGMAWNDSLGLMGLDLTNLIAGATNYVETSPQLGAGAVWTTYSRIMASQTGLRWYDLGDLSSRTGLFYRIRIEPKQ